MALVGVAHSVGILDVHYTVPLSLNFEEWFPIRSFTEGEGVMTNINKTFLLNISCYFVLLPSIKRLQ